MTTIFKKGRIGLVHLSIFMNVCGHATVAQDMPEETTHLGRTEVDEACQADAPLFRRSHKLQLDQEVARLSVRFDRSVMDREENACRHRRQKKILVNMLVKGIIPNIYKHRVECPLRSRPYRTGHQAIRPRTYARTASRARTQTNPLLSDSPMPPSWIFSLLVPRRRHDPKPPPEMS